MWTFVSYEIVICYFVEFLKLQTFCPFHKIDLVSASITAITIFAHAPLHLLTIKNIFSFYLESTSHDLLLGATSQFPNTTPTDTI